MNTTLGISAIQEQHTNVTTYSLKCCLVGYKELSLVPFICSMLFWLSVMTRFLCLSLLSVSQELQDNPGLAASAESWTWSWVGEQSVLDQSAMQNGPANWVITLIHSPRRRVLDSNCLASPGNWTQCHAQATVQARCVLWQGWGTKGFYLRSYL